MDTIHCEGQTKFKSGPRACSACSVAVTKNALAMQKEHTEDKKKKRRKERGKAALREERWQSMKQSDSTKETTV